MDTPKTFAPPDWPALMDAQTAGAYLSLSEATFRILAAKVNLQPADIGTRLRRYRRCDLDRLVHGLKPVTDMQRALPSDATAERLAAEALARTAKRRRASR
jgi:hypothetical protein